MPSEQRNLTVVLAFAVILAIVGFASADEKTLPYGGPTKEYQGRKLPDLEGKEFAVAPDSLTGTPGQKVKLVQTNDEVSVIALRDTTANLAGDTVVHANVAYDEKSNQYRLRGKYYWSQPRQGSVDLLESSIVGSDKAGKVVMEIDFGLFNGKLQRVQTYYLKLREL